MRTSIDGPVILYGNDNPQQVSNTDAGPNVDYQSNALLDSRYVSQVTGAGSSGGINAFHNPVELEILSSIPTAAGAANIAAAQAPTIGGFFTLASANVAGVAVNLPLVPFGTAIQPTSVTVPVIALDYGFAIGTTVAGSAVLTLTGPSPTGYTATATYASRFFYPGQRLLIAGAGNVGGTLPLSTSVLATDRYAAPGSVVQATGIVLLSSPSLFTGTVYVGTSDQEYGVAVKPVVKAGAVRVYDPAQMTSRQVIVTASGASTGTVTIRGYDIYEQAMSETQTIVGTGVTVPKKAFAYISSVQLNTGATLTGTLSVGTNAAMGIPARADLSEYLTVWQNGVELPGTAGGTQAGVTFADQTPVATPTTGDVRGIYLPGTSVPNGTVRYVMYITSPIAQAKVSNNIDFRGVIGVVQA
jgi:hypothetical protein